MTEKFKIRCFASEDAQEVQMVIHRGLREVNGKDYPAKFIENICARFSIGKILSQADSAHTYVAVSENGKILGTGTIAPYWNSEHESILLTIYVLPDCIGNGIGTAIIKALENDEFFLRAGRIEIPSSITAVGFYRKMGYVPKDGKEVPDEEGLVRMEKILTLKTVRLHISPMRDNELQEMIAVQEVPELKQAFSEMLDGGLTDPEHRIWFVPWKITLAENPKTTIGTLGFKGPQKNGGVEIGYGMNSGFVGQGYMTEAVAAVVQWALAQRGVHSVFAETEADNGSSQRILKKLGFVPCGSGAEGPRFQKTK